MKIGAAIGTVGGVARGVSAALAGGQPKTPAWFQQAAVADRVRKALFPESGECLENLGRFSPSITPQILRSKDRMVAHTGVETIGRCLPRESGKFSTLFHTMPSWLDAAHDGMAVAHRPGK